MYIHATSCDLRAGVSLGFTGELFAAGLGFIVVLSGVFRCCCSFLAFNKSASGGSGEDEEALEDAGEGVPRLRFVPPLPGVATGLEGVECGNLGFHRTGRGGEGESSNTARGNLPGVCGS